jgi:hypothetical protein
MLLVQPPPAQVVLPVQHVAFPMQQPFQPPMQQQQYQQAAWYGCGQQGQFQGGGGRQGGRGWGRGGSQGGRQHCPSFATMICNQQGQGQLAPYQGYQGGMFAPPNPFGGMGPFLPAAKATTSTNTPSPIKRFAKWNACFYCGFDVGNGHTLVTCPFGWHKPNHQVGYTRENAATYTAYGPSTKCQHKTQFLALQRIGAEDYKACRFKHLVSAHLDPTNINLACSIAENDNATVVTLNISSQPPMTEVAGFIPCTRRIDIDVSHGIADT